MSILVLAPTLKTPSGHDHAFCTELIGYSGASEVKILASERFQPESSLPATPFFSVDPYEYRWIHKEAKQPLLWRELLRSASQDLQKIDFSPYEKLIFHTADPIYLVALARSLRRFRGDLYLGFMLPPSFWLRETRGRKILLAGSDLAILLLRLKARVILYSETGGIRFDHRSLDCLLKLPPVQSIAVTQEPRTVEPQRYGSGRIKIGFFGAAFDDKGFQILLQLAENAEVKARFQFKVLLPPGQQELVDKISRNGDTIVATSEDRDVPTYFSCVASVDLVYTLYSPLAYRDRMSGVVQDAILAGKPLLVATECTEMRRFIDQVAPGAYVHASYSAPAAAICLALTVDKLRDLSKQAKAGAQTIRKLKTFDSFFEASGRSEKNVGDERKTADDHSSRKLRGAEPVDHDKQASR
jgi:hypothetical protein